MNIYGRITAALAASLVMLFFCGCNKDTAEPAQSDTSETTSSRPEYSADEIRRELPGEWGRLEKVMHYFLSDGSCVIGGMQGTYAIDDNRSLILTTMSGSVTEYVWAESFAETDSSNYWYLDGDIITINGNQFTKISDTVDTP